MLGFAGVMVPLRRLAMAQAAVLSVVAIGLASWQVLHLLDLVGTAGWRPGPGIVLVIGGGVAAGAAAYRLRREA
jgi:NADPH-dependent 2,4-dienoyl-CoA reductase/sulfur reductase-like enzyme